VIVALGALRDADSVTALRRAAERDPDPVARLEAAWALASIGDRASAEVVLAVADDSRGFDRTRANNACVLLAENLLAAGRKEQALNLYRRLRDTRTDPADTHVRAAAARALAQTGAE